tara:strand:+ start:1806 stop:2096 length:291 start_codon:yes stop_codon:yes gene_type:complete
LGIVKSNLVNQLSDNYPNILKKDINKIVEIFLEEIKRTLKSERRVELRNFAVWYSKKQKKKNSRNPKTGQIIEVPEKKSVQFKMTKNLFIKINNAK